jgi:histidinol-phosphate/aromatic aminotransferase/cobyric acid decarboxylase-like protein
MVPFVRRELSGVSAVPHGATHNPAIIDFSSSVISLPIPIGEIAANTNFFCYPDSASHEFCAAVAAQTGCAVETVTAGNGASELIWLAGLAFLSSESRVGVLSPTFGEYARISAIMGASVHPLTLREEEDFATSSAVLTEFIAAERISVFFLCNPNNPTGHLLSSAELGALADASPQTLFIIDLAYVDYTDFAIDSREFTNRTNVVLLHSLTKAFGIAGLRAGYALAHPSLSTALHTVRPPWNMNALAQNAATFLIRHRDNYLEFARQCQRDAATLADRIRGHGFTVIPSTTDYFMVKVSDALACREQMLQRQFLVRELASMGQPRFIRLNVCRPQHVEQFLESFLNR